MRPHLRERTYPHREVRCARGVRRVVCAHGKLWCIPLMGTCRIGCPLRPICERAARDNETFRPICKYFVWRKNIVSAAFFSAEC